MILFYGITLHCWISAVVLYDFFSGEKMQHHCSVILLAFSCSHQITALVTFSQSRLCTRKALNSLSRLQSAWGKWIVWLINHKHSHQNLMNHCKTSACGLSSSLPNCILYLKWCVPFSLVKIDISNHIRCSKKLAGWNPHILLLLRNRGSCLILTQSIGPSSPVSSTLLTLKVQKRFFTSHTWRCPVL